MGRGVEKIFGLCIIAAMLSAGSVAAAPVFGIDETLQPQGLNAGGIYALRQIDPNLTGSGVKFAVIYRSNTYTDGVPQNDYRPAVGHNCFKDKQLNFNDRTEPSASVSSHSTAICSILLGEDPNASNPQLGRFRYQGAAPQGQADNYEFWYFLTNNVFSDSPPDADIITASFGTQFEDWWTRGIEAMAEQHGLIVVTGVGNGSNAYDPPLYPGAGSNVIGVGVVNSVNTTNLTAKLANFSLPFPEHSSLGPTADGRCKPDIVAPGNCLAADANNPDNYEPTGNWSSFSTPIVAGAIGLLVQKAKEDPELSQAVASDGGNCVMKAILLNSAEKLPFWHKGRLRKDDDHESPLDYMQGAGMLNAVGAYKNLIAGQYKPGDVPVIGWDNSQLLKSENPQNIYKITIEKPADKFITATVNWNKHYKSNYPFEALPEKDANLRLEIWAVDANDPGSNYLLDYSDSKADNIEHIYAKADANITGYELIVTFSDINDPNKIPADQPYGLAWDVTKQNKDNVLWYDINADGIVNDMDFNLLIDNLLANIKTPDAYLLGDINANGAIDAGDLRILTSRGNLKANWLIQSTPK